MIFESSRLIVPLTALPTVGSTFDVVDTAAEHLATWATLDQTAGRGRLGREWVAPAGRCLAASILVRPSVPEHQWSWLPLAVGLALVQAVDPFVAGRARLKWPNDVLVGERKVAGILCERRGDAVVVGIGVNLTLDEASLPTDSSTSLALEGADGTAEALADAVLHDTLQGLRDLVPQLGSEPLRTAIERHCVTLGSHVRVALPDGSSVTGTATRLGPAGEVELDTDAGPQSFSVGDVTHVR